MTTPQNPPSAASGTAPFTTREHLCRLAAAGHGVASAMDCEKTLQVGIFFDGTNNNRNRDKAESPPSHTNVVRPREGFEGRSVAERCRVAPDQPGRTAMKSTAMAVRSLLCLLALSLCAAACQPKAAGSDVPLSPAAEAAERAASPAMVGVSIRGYNFTDEGVQDFIVDGSYGSNLPPYGGGGASSCCVRLPFAWHEGQTVKVKWTIGHFTVPYEQRKHLSIDEEYKCCWTQRTLEKSVPVQRYDKPNVVQVFFMPNDELEVWASGYDLGHPDHPSGRSYPVDPRKPRSASSSTQ